MYPDLADNKLGSTGHSQGGQAAFTVLQLAEAKWGDKMIYAGLAMEPASGFGAQPTGGTWQEVYAKIKSPMFMFSGTMDVLVSESWCSKLTTPCPRRMRSTGGRRSARHTFLPRGTGTTDLDSMVPLEALGRQRSMRVLQEDAGRPGLGRENVGEPAALPVESSGSEFSVGSGRRGVRW